ncbi:MAG: tRNA pseudouridine(38-40) synthase TruA [Candidatus Methylomirabilis sp.]|nr:tRNA pseudouridine(38-40) synthase TruA [Deltaproteobacteria bacterium]
MRNIRLVIEYEGTSYAGWQVQEGLPTLQGSLVEAARKLTQKEAVITGASRTDAGVHALGQVASLKTESDIPCWNIMQGMNAFLPKDIVIKEASDAAPEFDPRRDSKGKTYVYRIINRDHPSALLGNFTWHIFNHLDLDAMRQAASHLIGEKDFSSFRAAGCEALHPRREVTAIEIEKKEGGLVEIEVRGTAFLRHMVRIIAGTLAAVGKGKLSPEDIPRILDARNRTMASQTAPARGLVLVKVEY